MPGGATVDVVIVAYRCEAVLRRCLASLRDHGVPGMHVHVVDNASGDGTAEMVAREFGEAELTVLPSNRGFAAASNVGIEAGGAPRVLVLNPDAALTGGALQRVLEVMGARPDVGICGARLDRDDGSFDHAAKRSFPTPLAALAHFTGVGRRPGAPQALRQYRAPDLSPDESGPVDAVNGAFMLIRREALEQVGTFDERYWMYMEDLDLCYRFAQAGWVTWYEGGARAVHTKAASSGPHRNLRLNYAFHRGMHRFYRAHQAAAAGALERGAVYAGIWAKFGVAATRSALARALAFRR